ncbi:MAG: proton-conducting transporter membrane subunit, partial [Acidimicrobiia bacterium]
FKALLFLCAGSVIHSVHSNNMSDMGGLRRFMPTTFWTWVVGALALSGIGLSGFWSKDEILATMGERGLDIVLWISITGAFVTAFYMARATFLTFFGTYKGDGKPHESSRILTIPLVVLAVPAAFAGFLNIPGLSLPRLGNYTEWLAVRLVPMGDPHADSINFGLAAIGLGAAILGVVIGWLIYYPDAETQLERDSFEIPVLFPLLRKKYYIDDLALGIVAIIKGPLARFVDWTNTYILDLIVNGVAGLVKGAGVFVYDTIDQRGVDGVFNGLSAAVDGAGSVVRKWQSGRVQQYAAAFVAGALILVVLFVFVLI